MCTILNPSNSFGISLWTYSIWVVWKCHLPMKYPYVIVPQKSITSIRAARPKYLYGRRKWPTLLMIQPVSHII